MLIYNNMTTNYYSCGTHKTLLFIEYFLIKM